MNGRLRLLPLLVCLAPLAGCLTSGSSLMPLLGPDEEPWQLPAGAWPSQRLYRIKYDGPEGHFGFKLTLYLQAEAIFRMQAADGLGRRIWDLSIDANDQALWLDHRDKRYCRARGASRLGIVPLGRLPLVALPKLLLGRLPAEPAADLRRTREVMSYRDARGQLWNGGLLDGRLEWWSLVEEERAVAWWRREGDGGVFSDLRGEMQLRWREVVHEPLARPPAALAIPPKYAEGACGG